MSHITTPLPHPYPAALPPKAAQRLMETPKSRWPESPRRNLPPWDRVIDIVYHKYRRGQRPDNGADAFGKSVELFYAEQGRSQDSDPSSPYLKLPAVARFRICQSVVEHHSRRKPITLDKKQWTKEVWRDCDFVSLESALKPLRRYLSASFALRADIMVAFLMTERFHVTFSPFVNPYFDPMATLWCERYGHFMQNIVLELDMTRLRFSPAEQAQNLKTGILKIDTLIKTFVKTQMKRKETSSLRSLVLLCRRFYGQRPQVDSPTAQTAIESAPDSQVEDQESEKTPAVQETEPRVCYCPEESIRVCEPLVELEGMVDSIRLCGFSNEYTHSLLHRIFPIPEDKSSLKHHAYRVSPSTVWPRLQGQSSWIDVGQGRIELDDHCQEPLRGPNYAEYAAVQLPPPYVDAFTRIMSIHAPLDFPRESYEASESYERPGSRMKRAGRDVEGSVCSDVESLEKRMQGLAHKIRRSISKRETREKPSIDRRLLERASLERSWLDVMPRLSSSYAGNGMRARTY